MCLHCEGFSEEEIERSQDLTIRIHGWLLQSVSDEEGVGWSYTVGLTESYGHPELICLDIALDDQVQVIRWLADQVVATGRIDADAPQRGCIELLPVHRDHLATDLIATWLNRYDRVPEGDEFLQIVFNSCHFCEGHDHYLRLLDRPDVYTRGGYSAQLPNDEFDHE